MVKLLILAYDFPPYVSVGGLRPYSWYKYLHEFDVYPIVITRQWNNYYKNALDYVAPGFSDNVAVEESSIGTIIRTPHKPNAANRLLLKYGEKKYRFLRKVISGWYEIVQWFLPVGPKIQIYREADRYLRTHKVDCIIATGDPFVLFKYAALLSKKHKIPWIADYRDPWSKKQKQGFLYNRFSLALERYYCKSAMIVISVCDYVVNLIQQNLKSQRFFIVYNGYDTELPITFEQDEQPTSELSIAYAGTIYPWHPWKDTLDILHQFCVTNNFTIRLNFYGVNIAKEIQNYVARYSDNLLCVTVFPRIPNQILLSHLAKAHLLLLFNDYYVVGTKIYDYISLMRPILLCFTNDKEALELKKQNYILPVIPNYRRIPQAELIEKTQSGYIVENREALVSILDRLKDEFWQNQKILSRSHGFEFYSRKNQAYELSKGVRTVLNLPVEQNNSFGIANPLVFDFSTSRSISATQEEYKICSYCVMDTSDEDIVFDSEGRCNHCKEFEQVLKNHRFSKHESQSLDQLVQKIKFKGKDLKYDCIVGLSGGVDSCYTLYLVVKMGLRPLALHMDNGWNSEIAVSNVEKMVSKLGLDYISEVLDWNEFRKIQLAFIKSSIVDIEIPTDLAIPACLYQTAAKYNISYIISGGNFSSEGILPLTWGYHQLKDIKLYRHIVKNYGGLKRITIPSVGLWGEIYYKIFRRIKTIYPLNYIEYNKEEAREFLKNEFGWQDYEGKHHESRITGFWQSYVMFEKFNMDYRRATLSSQIVSGQISREEALKILEKKPYDSQKIIFDMEYIAKKFDILPNELEIYLNFPPKTYKDFPNQKKTILAFYNVYRKLFK